MGSDDGFKSISLLYRIRRELRGKRIRRTLVLLSIFLLLGHWIPPPEDITSQTFQADLSLVPPQCHDKAKKFYDCQQQSKHRWVMACHRKWCNGWGHCEPCSGIGDRTRSLLNQVETATEACIKVQLDFPVADIMTLDSAIYHDPWGWIAELLHFRSYKVSDRHSVDAQAVKGATSTIFSHFTPPGYQKLNYDPCYFHILFQPTRRLQQDLDLMNERIGNHSIGLHYRTGDAAAFGIDNNDTRVAGDAMEQGWKKMLQCAEDLVGTIFSPDDKQQPVTYFLATDNGELKQRVRNDPRIVTTDDLPNSYLRGLAGDRGAWEEMYLLSNRQGMVVNVRPTDYAGTASRLSFFSILARKIGFLPDDHVRECVLD